MGAHYDDGDDDDQRNLYAAAANLVSLWHRIC